MEEPEKFFSKRLDNSFSLSNDFWNLFKYGERSFKEDDYLTALKYFEEALKSANSPDEKELAEFTLINLRNRLIEQWHWPMLNDAKRNFHLFEALKEALKKFSFCNFLDIGTGSGIFAILASNLANKCVGIEQNKVMYNLAKEIRDQNCFYDLLLNYSFDCSFKEKFHVLLSETLDCAIFGEGILDTLIDAKQRFMIKNSIIIPGKAHAIFALIESEDIAKENFFELEKNRIIISPCCNYETNYTPVAPYDCDYLNELPSGYRLLSSPTQGFSIDFNNLKQMEYFRNNQFKEKLTLESSEIGSAHGVVMWFRLDLFNGIELCSSPTENLCWQQTIFPFYPPKNITKVHENFEFLMHVYEQRLYVIPLNSNVESVVNISRNFFIADPEFDISANNNSKIKEFFKIFLDNIAIQRVIDATNLCLKFNEVFSSIKFSVKTDSRILMELLNESDLYFYRKEFNEPDTALFFWPFSDRGTLNYYYLLEILEEFGQLDKIKFIPSLIYLKGCFVSSEELFKRYKLSKESETFCGVDLSSMRRYEPEYIYEIPPNMFNFVSLTENFDLLEIDFTNPKNLNKTSLNFSKEIDVAINSNGNFHAILLWYEIEHTTNFESTLNSYRFSLPNDGTIKLSAYVLNNKIELKADQNVHLKISLFQGDVYIRNLEVKN